MYMRLVINHTKTLKLAAEPNFKPFAISNEDVEAIHMKRTRLVFDKLVYRGMSILYISKNLMYNFHYNYIQKMYRDRLSLLLTDAASLMYEIETKDSYKDISGNVKVSSTQVITLRIMCQGFQLEKIRRSWE